MEHVYTLKKILDILNISPPKPTVYREEKKGLIPTAKRIKRGSTEVRVWTEDQIPEFGKKYGNIRNENGKTKFISINANKGGTLKTTISFNLARFLALNGLKVLCCGLEVSQKSLTRSLENMREIENISQIDDFEDLTLYDVAENKKSILEVIKKTTLPNLDYVPEGLSLSKLDNYLKNSGSPSRAFNQLFTDIQVNPKARKTDEYIYDVVIFDNSAYWASFLVKMSMNKATDVIMPFGCDSESYRSSTESYSLMEEFKDKELDVDKKWNSFSIVPTLRANTKLSLQIEAFYRNTFMDDITITSIRKYDSISGEANLNKKSVIEYDPKSNLADDYFRLLPELWERINVTGNSEVEA